MYLLMIYHYDLAALIVLENVYISVYIYIFFLYIGLLAIYHCLSP